MPKCLICDTEFVKSQHNTRQLVCNPHTKEWSRYRSFNSLRRGRGREEMTYSAYKEHSNRHKALRGSNRYSGLADTDGPDIKFDGKTPPCLSCRHKERDKSEFGCVKCDERERYAISLEFLPIKDHNCNVVIRADSSHTFM
jgi:hypothetical protein